MEQLGAHVKEDVEKGVGPLLARCVGFVQLQEKVLVNVQIPAVCG